MIKKIITAFTFLFLLHIACTEKEVRQLELKGEFQVKISTYTELGTSVNDKAGIEVIIEGSVPKRKIVTDTSGTFIIKDFPMGTYNLIISKDGYGTVKVQSLKFIGDDKPYIYSTPLVRKSTTQIKCYSLDISGNTLTLNGVISHQYPKSSYYPNFWPGLTVYLSNSCDVSSANYLNYINFYSNRDVDTTFNTSLNINSSLFPKGSKVYTIIYGRNRYSYSYYDYEKNVYYDPFMGDPSEIKSIVIP